MPGFFKAIWDSAQATKPGALVEICPCGTGYSFFTLPYLNMTVASDPESSWQIAPRARRSRRSRAIASRSSAITSN